MCFFLVGPGLFEIAALWVSGLRFEVLVARGQLFRRAHRREQIFHLHQGRREHTFSFSKAALRPLENGDRESGRGLGQSASSEGWWVVTTWCPEVERQKCRDGGMEE